MHWHVLKQVLVWQYQVGMEFKTTLAEAPEYPYDLISWKQLYASHGASLLPIPSLSWIDVL